MSLLQKIQGIPQLQQKDVLMPLPAVTGQVPWHRLQHHQQQECRPQQRTTAPPRRSPPHRPARPESCPSVPWSSPESAWTQTQTTTTLSYYCGRHQSLHGHRHRQPPPCLNTVVVTRVCMDTDTGNHYPVLILWSSPESAWTQTQTTTTLS